ncbi:hypothetical protein EDD86DRAFT_83604 [Gorgonomyces haynaldii]|nr:hypothetical protein EDD86DRAFT_83604 [Gorgonomyces haynaldii]
MSLEEDLEKQMLQLKEAVHQVKENLQYLQGTLDEQTSQMRPLDRADVLSTTCFTLDTLIFLLLRTYGIPPKSHRIYQEVQRVRGYFDKIQKARTKKTGIDKKAAARFIKQAVGSKN